MVKLIQRIDQKQNLSPQQILEANVLQLTLSALEKKIYEEIESNPVLEINEDNDLNENDDADNEGEEFEWDELVSNPEEYDYKSYSSKDDFINSAQQNIPSNNLVDDMLEQLKDLNADQDSIKIAIEILGNLDDKGYLTIDPILISDRLELPEKMIFDTLESIKMLEPPGIGSLDLQDCIISQLKVKFPNEKFALDVIKNYFDDFANRRFNQIIKKTHCDKNMLHNVVDIVSVLNPNPAINYFSESAEQIVPDFIVEKNDGEWRVSTNSTFIPELRISPSYIKMLDEHNKDKEVKKFVKNKMDRANWFINAINQREITCKKVMLSIIKHQKAYFDSDDKQINPLILKDIADDIKMDISTISRVTNGKYVQTPWGIENLKMFFSESIKTKNGEVVSSHFVKNVLKQVISNEDKTSPFSDDILTEKINKLGYVIARRTIAKYRENLNIPSARLRKEIK